MKISKKLMVVGGLFGAMALGIAATMPQQQQQGPPPITNLKVLPKKISFKELDQIMDTWSASLGVRCNFCHARNDQTNHMDFASDAKPEKNMAREMFEMTAKINKKFFKAEKDTLGMVMFSSVNCNTCHNGKAHPEAKMPEEHRGPGGPPPGPGGPPPGGGPGGPPPPNGNPPSGI